MDNKPWFYRGITVAGLVLAVFLAFIFPYRLREPDPWAYYFAIENFAQGRFVLSEEEHMQQVRQAEAQGGWLAQYIRLDDGTWVLEKAPGYPLFVVPFKWLGIPRAANVVLALGVVLVTYLLLKQLAGERAAAFGSLLVLFTPVSLIMLHRSYMAMFAASSFLFIGGGLYLYAELRKEALSPLLLFLSSFLLGWSVVSRYSNLIVVFFFTAHFGVTRLIGLFKHPRRAIPEAVSFAIGMAIPFSILLAYNAYVFGSPFDYGYKHSPFAIEFAHDFLGQVTPDGKPIPLLIIWENLRRMPVPLLLGFPVLAMAIPAMFWLSWRKIVALVKRGRAEISAIAQRLPWSLLLLLVAWGAGIYLFYLEYKWTVGIPQDVHFIIIDRFYLPGLFPLVVLASLLLARAPGKFAYALLTLYVLMGVVLYVQAARSGGLFEQPRIVGAKACPRPLEEIIARVCHAVKVSPTDEENIERRFDVLLAWVGLLREQGYDVDRILPPHKAAAIAEAIGAGEIEWAAHRIVEAYQGFEELVEERRARERELIDRVRQEVRTSPTNEENIGMRLDVLFLWARHLMEEGYDVDRVLPPERAAEIGRAMEAGDVARAARLVDAAYQDLEDLAK